MTLATEKKRALTCVNAYLILKNDDQILLGLRRNTGYCDGYFGLVAGHVEDDESATDAIIREAREEIGIQMLPSHLKVTHVMHRQSNRLNVDIFFISHIWEGEVKNCEPEKCEKVEFFPIKDLPENIIDYQKSALEAMQKGVFYSELGW